MTYERHLAFQLRLRGQTEDEIAEVIREVRAHELVGDDSTASVFGSPEEYAGSFEKRKRRTPGSALAAIAVIVAVIGVVGFIVVGLIMKNTGADLALGEIIPSWMISGGAVVFVGVATLAGFLVDYLRPVPRT